MGERLIEVKNLTKHFLVKGDFKHNKVQAVDDVSFYIDRGETLGLVGESGCGKTTIGRTLLRLYEPTSGNILYKEKDITRENMRPYRSKMQIIFQDPYASLDPRMTVGDIVGEPLDINKACSSKKERSDRVFEILALVGLSNEHANRYPHEFSGGQRQRIGIARAIYRDPDVLLFDEATSALDNLTEHAIMDTLQGLTGQKTIIMVAHRLTTLRLCDRIVLLEGGRITSEGTYEEMIEKSEFFRDSHYAGRAAADHPQVTTEL
jgi:oligopeptide transport system ATP-binding protein